VDHPAAVVPAADSPGSTADADPYRYGWRERREVAPDGSEKVGWIPLTYRDLLDPQEGDYIAESTIHRRVVEGVAHVLTRRYEDDPGVAVWCNLKIVFRIPGLTTGPGPDICVVDGVLDRDRGRKSFHFGREPGKVRQVRLVVEVVSEDSVRKDYQDLLRIYAPLGVQEYVAVRPLGLYPDGPFELRGWHLDPRTRRLLPIAPNPQGQIPSLATGLLFGTGSDGFCLSLWNAASGERLLSPEEDVTRLRERAEQAEERAEQAEERVERAEERADRESEARRTAEEARSAAEAARRSAVEEQQRALKRNREMAAELEQLRAQLRERE
jgi:Uma2 family endonuclease